MHMVEKWDVLFDSFLEVFHTIHVQIKVIYKTSFDTLIFLTDNYIYLVSGSNLLKLNDSRKVGKSIFVNQARVIRNIPLVTENGTKQHLYLIGWLSHFIQCSILWWGSFSVFIYFSLSEESFSFWWKFFLLVNLFPFGESFSSNFQS